MSVQTVDRWRCLGTSTSPFRPCEESGEGPGSDLAARKHTAATGHATCTFTTPKEAAK